ncbi:MAG: T9SS type A sorting domain-containing protein [Bacteroidetes bacterium]|nr:T9SS type A sorting domain-containing protein [Bacteroidota bacterium]
MKKVIGLIFSFAFPLIVLGQTGNAVSFNGTNTYGVRQTPITTVSDVTLEGWVNLHSTVGSSIIFYYGNTASRGFGLFRIGTNLHFLSGGTTLFNTSIPIPTDEWHHWAISRNSSGNVVIYKDGLSVFTNTFGATTAFSTDSLNIGGRANTEYSHADYDEFRLWSVTRTPSEIQDNRNEVLVGNEPNLVAYYHFDEADGAVTAVDGSINSNKLALRGPVHYILSNITLPVELVSFTGSQQKGKILLSWETKTETNNYGWEVEKSEGVTLSANEVSVSKGRSEKLEWETIGFVAGKGTTTEAQKYEFTSLVTSPSSPAVYRLKQLDLDGTVSYSQLLVIEGTPAQFELAQNYPNPFNPTTQISYSVPMTGNVMLLVYDALGREVETLVNASKSAGTYVAEFNGEGKTSGLYFVRMTAGGFSSTKKMMLVK